MNGFPIHKIRKFWYCSWGKKGSQSISAAPRRRNKQVVAEISMLWYPGLRRDCLCTRRKVCSHVPQQEPVSDLSSDLAECLPCNPLKKAVSCDDLPPTDTQTHKVFSNKPTVKRFSFKKSPLEENGIFRLGITGPQIIVHVIRKDNDYIMVVSENVYP